MKNIKIGNYVTRVIGGAVRMRLQVTAVTENYIICGSWVFDRATGMEIDEELGWGPKHGRTGSILEGETK